MTTMRLWKRESGYFYVTFKRGDHKSLKTKDRKQAEQIFRRIKKEQLLGRLIRLERGETRLLGDFIREYLAYRQGMARNTVRADRLALGKFFEFYSNKPMAGITPKRLDEFKAFLLVTKLKKSSINNYIRHLKRAIKTAIKWGYLAKNPLDGFSQLKVDYSKPIFMDKSEVQKLLDTASRHDALKTAIPVMIYCGISRSEIIKPIIINEDLIQYKRQKTGKLITVPIHSELRPYLAHLKPGIHKLVPWKHPDTLTHHFNKVVREAGLKGITPHKVRHTFATLLLQAGAELSVVSELLGHSDINVTKRFYAHVVEGLKRTTVELLRFNT